MKVQTPDFGSIHAGVHVPVYEASKFINEQETISESASLTVASNVGLVVIIVPEYVDVTINPVTTGELKSTAYDRRLDAEAFVFQAASEKAPVQT